MQRKGKVKFIGISTHNTVIALKAVKSGKIDVLMFPVNPLFNLMPRDYLIEKIFKSGEDLTEEQKRNYPSKQELFEECDRRNIGVVAMKPFAAGRILKNTGGGEKNSLMSLTPVQCISYILDQKGVTVALPGFKNVKELEEALAYFTATPEEKDYRAEVEKSDAYKFDNHCMYCNHCLPCPQNINVAEVTKLTDMALKGMTDEILSLYKELDRNAGDCLMCGTCADRCPFSIDVIKNMEQAQQLFHS